MNVIFENERAIAVDKPSGWLTIPGRMGAEDGRLCVQVELSKNRNAKFFPVHRLDYEVSGLVLFAKDADAHRLLNGWFEAKKIAKIYEALTEGLPPLESPRKNVWKSHLLRGKKRAYEKPFGKLSVTEAEFLGAWKKNYGLWSLRPVTGRAHQLRYELAKHGMPIWGDELYGAKEKFSDNAIALRSRVLDFSETENFGDLALPERIELKPQWNLGE